MKMFALIKFLVILVAAVGAVYYNGRVVCSVADYSIDVPLWGIIVLFSGLLYVHSWCIQIFKKVVSFFAGKPKLEKGLDCLQRVFSALLLKDTSATADHLIKAKQYLGDIPIVSWLEGQFCLINGDELKAKSIFYKLYEHEKNTAFGAYSLSQLAMKYKLDKDVVSAINAILKVHPHANEFIQQAISYSIENKNFTDARYYEKFLRDPKNKDKIESIICFEESKLTNDIELVKKAFKLAPYLEDVALHYANALMKDKEYRVAKKVIRQAFSYTQTQRLFQAYVSCAESIDEKIKLAHKLIDAVSKSWVPYFELAQLEIQKGEYDNAFHNLLIAYDKAQYDFIANELINTAKKINDPESQTVLMLNSLKFKHVRFRWECSNCKNKDDHWKTVCNRCNYTGTYEPVEEENCGNVIDEKPVDLIES